jgi:hypothetical protein
MSPIETGGMGPKIGPSRVLFEWPFHRLLLMYI